MYGAFHGKVRPPWSVRHTETVVSARVRTGAQTLLDRFGEGQGGAYRPFIRGRSHTPLVCLWQRTWNRPRLMMRSHWRWRWGQRYAAYAYTRRADTPTSTWNNSNSGNGRRTLGSSQIYPTDGSLDVSVRHFKAHVEHGEKITGIGMDYTGSNSKREH